MKAIPPRTREAPRQAGFTLPEVLMAAFIFGVVMAAALGVYTTAHREWKDTDVTLSASHRAGLTMERIVYGEGANLGLRSAQADSVAVNSGAPGWTLDYRTPDGLAHRLEYNRAARTIRYGNSTIGTNAVCFSDSVTASSIENTGAGLRLSLTVRKEQGRLSSDSTISTFVNYRN